MDKTLLVTEIERCAVHDGPGIRTVVFLQGCPLHCTWCCNPETQSMTPILMQDEKACVGCGACEQACPAQAISLADGKVRLPRESCLSCRTCVDACPAGALKLSSKEMTIDQILAEVLRDAAYYKESGGGLTLSGGEPLLQEASIDLLKAAKDKGLHVVVETTAGIAKERLQEAIPYVDEFFVDYKHPEEEPLKKATGLSLKLWEENVEMLLAEGASVTLRTPLIPGYNDAEKTLKKCYQFAEKNRVEIFVLLPYHGLGKAKYKKLQRKYELASLQPQTPEKLETLKELGQKYHLTMRIGG